ncbi:MAG TPA: hypothetical protein VFL93_10805 [Longimicrobiaceae bacterium]|nr:hypothetical protein [Longimicrobiaceae bacterium]
MVWRQITGEEPPTVPPTAVGYTRAGLPRFDWYAEQPALNGAEWLKGLSSVHQLGKEKGEVPQPENALVVPENVVPLRQPRRGFVREGEF